MKLGELIRKWRLVSERDLRTVAKEIGIGYSTLHRVEKGERCDSMALSAILAWLLEENTKVAEDANA